MFGRNQIQVVYLFYRHPKGMQSQCPIFKIDMDFKINDEFEKV